MEESDAIKLLAIDDKPDNLTALRAVVREVLPQALVLTATNGPAGIELAAAEDPDAILLDIVMPGMDGFEVCRRLKADERLKDIPVVFLTALKTDAASRVKALEAGAEGFLAKPLETAELTAQIKTMAKVKAANWRRRTEKDRLEALVAERNHELQQLLEQVDRDRGALVSTLEDQRRAEESLRESEERFRRALIGAPIPIMIHAEDGQVVTINTPWTRLTGYEHSDIPTIADWTRKAYGTQMDLVRADIDGLYALDGPKAEGEYTITTRSGDARIWDFSSAPIGKLPDGRRLVISMAMDVTERKRMEEALHRKNEELSTMLDALPVMAWIAFDPECLNVTGNRAVSEIFAVPPGTNVSQSAAEKGLALKIIHLDNDGVVLPADQLPMQQAISTGQPVLNRELTYQLPDGRLIFALGNAVPLFEETGRTRGAVGAYLDITERKRTEAEREKLQAQLAQAQKMESVGRLAGGVAHDFNNMLGIILGHVDMVLEQMDPDQPFHDDLMEIRKAAQRSADLTRQLLAFARKQTVAPKVIDLNQIVSGMTRMLHRLIGEDIDMAWIPGGKVWLVKIDPGQIDQILANLCVNARDAIAGVGKVTIETGNIVFDEDYCADHAGFVPGEYVMVAVSDNGCGMDSETLSHLFEPFFTTKELGKGTGLGLATVYGVVKQNNGFINVYSEPGQGTTFRIYLPRHRAKEAPPPDKEAIRPAARGHETILLVEDEPAILRITAMMLERGGYSVLAAGTPGEAIRLANEHTGDIHLLMTDVVMPEMNGRDLAKNILSLYPSLKCLFMSGFTANVIAHHGILDEGVNFIQKPFSKGELTVKAREILDRD